MHTPHKGLYQAAEITILFLASYIGSFDEIWDFFIDQSFGC